MYITETIEWTRIDGNIIISPLNIYRSVDDLKELIVEFEADPYWDNDGIGDYEYWGSREHDSGRDYVVMDEFPTWDTTKYTEEENKVIELFLASPDYKELEDTFCKKYAKETR